MAVLKWHAAGQWIRLYVNEIKNRLRRDLNLSDLTNVQSARNNLEIVGDNNNTHYHDSRYLPIINEFKENIETFVLDAISEQDKKIALLEDKVTILSNNYAEAVQIINNLQAILDQRIYVGYNPPGNPQNQKTYWVDLSEGIPKSYVNGTWVKSKAAYG